MTSSINEWQKPSKTSGPRTAEDRYRMTIKKLVEGHIKAGKARSRFINAAGRHAIEERYTETLKEVCLLPANDRYFWASFVDSIMPRGRFIFWEDEDGRFWTIALGAYYPRSALTDLVPVAVENA